LNIIQLDVTCDQSIQKALDLLQKEVQGEGLDLLINNAGVAFWVRMGFYLKFSF
jgi:NADP-dependent 3-hydroxy acid dehydrogenase YdfG